ncbi:MAG: FadR/GntR family transcriptional regulator [Mobilicoccus sp.]|nr:FadR/GntR family transcriptional regulator [Mobilicoccus sp.]
MTSAPDWRPVEKTRAYEEVIAQVEAQIAAGALKVGDRLPAERDLAARLGVSRAAVREAMRALEAMGVVRSGAGRDAGTVLTALSSEALTQLLRLHVALANFPTGDIIEARVMLERWSARLAAQHATDEDRAHMTALVEEMDDPDIDRTRFNECDTDFHVAIAHAGRNALVADMTSAIRHSMRSHILESLYGTRDWNEVGGHLRAGHRAILEAIVAGEGEVAADRVEEHIRYAYGELSWGEGRA